MPDQRTYPSVSSRNDLDFNQRPDPLRRTRSWLIWTCGLVALAPLAYTTVTKDETPYWAYECTTAHQIFQHKCRACHADTLQALRIKVQDVAYTRSVEDRTCRVCHPQYHTLDHNPQVIEADVESCFRCHQEHRRKADLAWVGDRHCTSCHAELTTKDGAHDFVASIPDFDAHPEFALQRASMEEATRPGPEHGVFTVARPSGEGGNGRWTDNSKIKFNHAYHLHANGVRISPSHPDFDPNQPEQVVHLDCADCHQMDAAGEYVQPIVYEKHCQQCHELKFTRTLHDDSPDLPIDMSSPLPHEAPELVRGVMRNRIIAYAQAHPEAVLKPERPRPSRLPHKADQPKPTAQELADWVEQELDKLEPRAAQTCRHCHTVETSEAATEGGPGYTWTVRPPEIPDRWMTHSRFRHDRHDTMRCVDCHYLQRPEDPTAADFRADAGSIYHSESASDILMPAIATCHQCHSDSASRRTSGRARTNCVECHRYHHADHTVTTDPAAVEALLGED